MIVDSHSNRNMSQSDLIKNNNESTIIISHRANIGGPNPDVENNPDQIDRCINEGYQVEIDLRINEQTGKLWLGHDEPQYEVSWLWLKHRVKELWIHCKDYKTLFELSSNDKSHNNEVNISASGCNFFWHQEDYYALTSNRKIWAFPGKPDIIKNNFFQKKIQDSENYQKKSKQFDNTILVLPEWENIDWGFLKKLDCYGICTDYPEKLK